MGIYDRELDFPRSGRPDRRGGAVITSLYRLYDAGGALLYVGITSRLVARLRQHRLRQPWGREIRSIEWTEFTDRSDASKAETAAIQVERPRHNIVHRANP